MSPALEADLLVAGGGMAGLTAAATAAQAGARVVVVEKTAAVGGSAQLSGGMVWTARDAGVLDEACPDGDRELLQQLLDGMDDLYAWIGSLGVHISEPAVVLEYGLGRRVDIQDYLSSCERVVTEAGGRVHTSAQVYELCRSGTSVEGARVFARGEEIEVSAPWTLLATGGFQASADLLSDHVHPNAPHALLRSNRASEGDGLRMGLDVGARLSTPMNGFYGHLVSWPVSDWNPGLFTLLSQYHSGETLLVDQNGHMIANRRNDHGNAQEVLRHPDAVALLVMDSRQRANQTPPTSERPLIDRFAVAVENGARGASASDLVELGRQTAEWGYQCGSLPDTVQAYNAMAPPEQRIIDPPFHALEVKAAVTATQGGLAINHQAQVLDAQGAPVPGLLAAGADAGGLFGQGYAGGLAAAGVFGRAAAATATRINP